MALPAVTVKFEDVVSLVRSNSLPLMMLAGRLMMEVLSVSLFEGMLKLSVRIPFKLEAVVVYAVVKISPYNKKKNKFK